MAEEGPQQPRGLPPLSCFQICNTCFHVFRCPRPPSIAIR